MSFKIMGGVYAVISLSALGLSEFGTDSVQHELLFRILIQRVPVWAWPSKSRSSARPRPRDVRRDSQSSGPFRVFEAVNQDRTFTGEVTACELHTVGHGTSVIGVWGKNYLDSAFCPTLNIVPPLGRSG